MNDEDLSGVYHLLQIETRESRQAENDIGNAGEERELPPTELGDNMGPAKSYQKR